MHVDNMIDTVTFLVPQDVLVELSAIVCHQDMAFVFCMEKEIYSEIGDLY